MSNLRVALARYQKLEAEKVEATKQPLPYAIDGDLEGITKELAQASSTLHYLTAREFYNIINAHPDALLTGIALERNVLEGLELPTVLGLVAKSVGEVGMIKALNYAMVETMEARLEGQLNVLSSQKA